MDSEIFEKLPPTKLFFRCAVPSMVTMAFASLYQIADGLFVGRFIGGDALAAINLIMPIIMIVFGFANLIATGASVRVSVLLGAKKQEEASQIFTSQWIQWLLQIRPGLIQMHKFGSRRFDTYLLAFSVNK